MRRILSQPLRTLLLLVILGVASAMFIASISFSLSCDRLVDNIYKYYNFDYSLELGRPQLPERIQTDLSNAIGKENIIIEPYSPPINVNMYKKDGSLENIVCLIGISNNSKNWSVNSLITSGKMYKNSNQALIGERLARNSNFKIGDIITIEAEDRIKYNFEVVGLVKSYENRGYFIYTMPEKVREVETGKADASYRNFAIRLANSEKLILEAAKKTTPDIVLTTLGDKMEQAKNAVNSFKLLVYMLAVLIFFAALFGLGININLGIWEKQQEIAVQLALGIPSRCLVASFIRQFVFQGIIAWLISIIGGFGLGYLLVQFFDKFLTPMDYYFSISSVLWSFLVITALCLVGSAITVSHLIKNINIPLVLKIQS
jgi:ABC-type lipoprotein release transport system permease subunit